MAFFPDDSKMDENLPLFRCTAISIEIPGAPKPQHAAATGIVVAIRECRVRSLGCSSVGNTSPHLPLAVNSQTVPPFFFFHGAAKMAKRTKKVSFKPPTFPPLTMAA